MAFSMDGLSCKRGSKMVFFVLAMLLLVSVIEASTSGSKPGKKPKIPTRPPKHPSPPTPPPGKPSNIVHRSRVSPCNSKSCSAYCNIIYGTRLVECSCEPGYICVCVAHPSPPPQVEKYNT